MSKIIIYYTLAATCFIFALGFIYLASKIILKAINDPQMKLYKRFKWHIKELDKTLSHQPGHYSSKRIERLILFLNANIILDICVIIGLQKDKIGAAEAVLIYTAQMLYAGFQTKQIANDVKPVQ